MKKTQRPSDPIGPRDSTSTDSPRRRSVAFVGALRIASPALEAHCGDDSLPARALVADVLVLDRREKFHSEILGLVVKEIES